MADDKKETVGERLARLALEKKAAELRKQQEADEQNNQKQREAEEQKQTIYLEELEQDRNAAKKFISDLQTRYPALLEGFINNSDAKAPTLSFGIFAYLQGYDGEYIEYLKPLFEELRKNNLIPIVLHATDKEVIRDMGENQSGRIVDSKIPWTKVAEQGGVLTVVLEPRDGPQGGLRSLHGVKPEDKLSGWLPAKPAQQTPLNFKAKHGAGLIAVGARWKLS